MEQNQKPRQLQAFAFALLAGVAIFLPFVIFDHGYFIYYGDFNVQQIPFYRLAHEAVRSGDLFWSWYTDLGANFVGSYSFYLLFSPFFWLTLPFPTAVLPYLMAPLLVLKTACASLSAYLFLSRFVRDTRYAVIGSLLYAFSGWMAFNIFFNHFHEVAVFFPLLLLGVEKLVQEDKRGLLALAVFLNATVNYWFFAGEAVFVLLYVLVRRTDKGWRLSLKTFFRIALEAVLGFGLSAAVVLPSVMALMGNPRTGLSELLTGWNIWLYWHEQRQPAIIQSLFFPPELPARPNFLPDHGAKWASLSGWLPLVSMTGVLAYFFQRRDDWVKKLLALCLVFALVPGLNSLFILLNDSYYARWFYMPLLLMALASARALEDCARDSGPFLRAIKWSAVVVILFAVMSGGTPHLDDDKNLLFGLADNPELMWIFAAIAATCLLLTLLLVRRFRGSKRFPAIVLAAVLVVSAGFTTFYLANGKNDRTRSQWLIDHAIRGREKIELPAEPFARVDVYDSTDNIAMYWHQPNIQAFHSIVPTSIMEFYPLVGVTRDVGSRPEADFFALRPLLSVRWLFIEGDKEKQDPMPGYRFWDHQNDFNIYENLNFLPMGFGYDRFITRSQLEDVTKNSRSNMMLRAVVLEEDAIARNSDILAPLEDEGYSGFTADDMVVDVEARRRHTALDLRRDNTGFSLTTDFDAPQLVFLSVPWERGWSARLSEGEGAGGRIPIERANVGFMAVRVPAGPAQVRLEYETPGLRTGTAISFGFLLVLLGYLLVFRRPAREPREDLNLHRSLLEGQAVNLTWEEYLAAYSNREARAAHLQQVLNQAAARHVAEKLEDEERTLHFSPPEEITQNVPDVSGDTREETVAPDTPAEGPPPPAHP